MREKIYFSLVLVLRFVSSVSRPSAVQYGFSTNSRQNNYIIIIIYTLSIFPQLLLGQHDVS